MEIFNYRLKTLRKQQGKTQQELADLLQVKRSTYGEYERGKIVPPVSKMQILSDFFGVSLDYLTGNSDLKTKPNETPIVDIAKQMKIIEGYLKNTKTAVTCDGEILDHNSREALIFSLENFINMAKVMKKRKI